MSIRLGDTSQTFNTMKPSSVVEAPNVSRYSFGNADEELRKEAEMELMKTDDDSQDSEIPLTVLDNNDEDRLISPEVNHAILEDPIDSTLPSSMSAILPPLSVDKSPKVLQPIQLLPSPSPSLDPEPARISPDIRPLDVSSQDPLNILAGVPSSLVQAETPFPSVIKREPEEVETHSDIEDRTLKSPDRSFTSMMAPEQSLSPTTMTSILRSNQHVNASLAPVPGSPVSPNSVLTFDFSHAMPRKPHRDIASRFARFGRPFAESHPSTESRKSVIESPLSVHDSVPSEIIRQSVIVESDTKRSGVEPSVVIQDAKPTSDELHPEGVDGQSVNDDLSHSLEEIIEIPVNDTDIVINESVSGHSMDNSSFINEQSVEEPDHNQKETSQYHDDGLSESNHGFSIETDPIHENPEDNGSEYVGIREENEVDYTKTLEECEVNYTETHDNQFDFMGTEEGLSFDNSTEVIDTGYMENSDQHGLGFTENLEEQEMGYSESPKEQELGYSETLKEPPHSGIFNDDGEIPLSEASPQEICGDDQLFEAGENEHRKSILPSDQLHSGIYNDDGEIPLSEQESNHSLVTEEFAPVMSVSYDRPSIDPKQSIAKEKEEPMETERCSLEETKTIAVVGSSQQHSTNVLDDLQRETGITLPVSVTRFVAQEVPIYTESELRREILNAEYRGKAKGKQLVVTVNVAMEALEKEKIRLEEQVKELESRMETVQAVRDRSKGRLDSIGCEIRAIEAGL